jgi:hypothetical protein
MEHFLACHEHAFTAPPTNTIGIGLGHVFPFSIPDPQGIEERCSLILIPDRPFFSKSFADCYSVRNRPLRGLVGDAIQRLHSQIIVCVSGEFVLIFNVWFCACLSVQVIDFACADAFNPDTAPVSAYTPSFETAARTLKVVPIIAPVHSDAEIEAAIIALGREPGGGLVVMPDIFTVVHRAPVILAAARNNVPAVYSRSVFAREGGLLSYGPDRIDTFRGAATYVDRILRGEKPGDLPVQFPTKFEMVVNRKAATALGLAIPPSILLRADDVIE